jgi:transcriptional regulator with XRE-family HTH domain
MNAARPAEAAHTPGVELVQTFGIVVRRLREGRRWSQEQLAAVSDLNRSYVGEVERGRVTASIVTAQKLAQAFEVDVASLLGRCEQIERERSERLQVLVAIGG